MEELNGAGFFLMRTDELGSSQVHRLDFIELIFTVRLKNKKNKLNIIRIRTENYELYVVIRLSPSFSGIKCHKVSMASSV